MRQLLRLAILLAAVNANATGLWINGAEQIAASGAGSVVTNLIPPTQYVTNATFATGLYGWTNAPGYLDPSQQMSHFSNATVQALKVQVWDSGESGIQFVRYVPVIGTGDNPVIHIRYWFTNTDDRSVRGQLIGPEDSDLFDFTNEGDGSTNETGIGTTADTLDRTNLIIALSANANGSLFIDSVYVWSNDFSANITNIVTNAATASGGPTIDGIVPLSTNRHTFLNGVRSP